MLLINNISMTSCSAEIIDSSCFYSEKSFQIYLNGNPIKEESCNSFLLNGLEPDTQYFLEIKNSNLVTYSSEFKTLPERVLLNVKKFGTAGDGEKDDTLAIQTAIMACPNGGRILIPNGQYKIKTLFLKSNITIELEEGAVLKGTGIIEDYAVLPGIIDGNDGKEYNYGSWEGNPLDTYTGIITGIDIENVMIIGKGAIDGGGNRETWWRDPKKKKRLAWRPRTIFLNRCKNVVLEGITVKNSPSWTVHPYFSNELKFLNLYIENPSDSPNTDGIDPESCKDILIAGVKFSVGDDCIAIKSGKIYMGSKYKVPTENMMIRNSLMQFGHGAVVMGSEMAGGIKGITVKNCIFNRTDRGIRIKTRRGRGEDAVIENILVDNVIMKDVATPFTANPFYFCDPDGKSEYVYTRDKLPVDHRTPLINDLTYKNIKADGMEIAAGYIAGLPEMPINTLTLENIEITATEKDIEPQDVEMFLFCPVVKKAGFIFENIKKVNIKNVVLKNIEGSKYDIK